MRQTSPWRQKPSLTSEDAGTPELEKQDGRHAVMRLGIGTKLAIGFHMLIQALLTADDFVTALAEVTPLRVALDPESSDRYFWLARPSSVTFIPERGVRIVTSAYLQWDVIGVSVPVTIRTAEVLLRPSIVHVDDQDILSMRAEIERLDLSHVPSLVEAPIVAALNSKLGEPEASLPWKFMETLDFHFKMPSMVAPLETLHLFAREGEARITENAVVLQVALGFSATHASDREIPSALTSQMSSMNAL
jgi:hypothetical protein